MRTWGARPESVDASKSAGSPCGGRGVLFTTFDGQLMMILHFPNGPAARPRIFRMQDTSDTLKVVAEFAGATP
jgi:hypothetical protein